MTIGAVRRVLRARAAGGTSDAGVAMLAAIMLATILLGMSALVLGIVVSQVRTTQFGDKNTRTIYAAEAGVEATLGKIRTAAASPDFTGKTYGDASQLPCSLSGAVDAAASGTTYSVVVQYFADDPAGHTDAWRSTNKLACTAGSGTGSVLPAYAYITSKGNAKAAASISSNTADRGISMIYQFKTTTKNVSGGRIWSWMSGTTTLCLRADGTTDGSNVSYRNQTSCGLSANDDTELWIYDTDYTIKLASSTTTGTPLCLTNVPTNKIQLKACGSPTYTQLWAWHNSGNATWVAQNSGKADNGYCLGSGRTSGTPADGDKLVVQNPCASQAAYGSFAPDPAVGPGAASINTHQIVNYLEFGRCTDVTDMAVGKAFMISYPCKQDPPDASGLSWNHRWYYNEPTVGTVAAPQLIYVMENNTTKYCLKTVTSATNPATGSAPDPLGSGYYPVLTSACNASDALQQWTRAMGTGNKTTSWTLRDSTGRCLSASGPKYKGLWTTLVVVACDGTTAQKWNAPADDVEAKTGNYLEETG